jgi:hypothetical protein
MRNVGSAMNQQHTAAGLESFQSAGAAKPAQQPPLMKQRCSSSSLLPGAGQSSVSPALRSTSTNLSSSLYGTAAAGQDDSSYSALQPKL